ncbi:MAG: GNAT family N-acetyltransferase [candidate division Zixibacteria bacterium]|nr:GNAT family N-acetyltransferase [candidate division Zixibacteria bacterium]MBU1469760.1 GNAT family N-acetyltransferase [candidate division Zixibacteria bacterium]MBU2624968.1 GNAT family N-acetyltransferase [candidate division Zixibacteria bacterium]
MIVELEPEDYHRAAHILEGHRQYVPALSVIYGDFPGRVFVDNSDLPRTAIVWAISRWAYIEGNADNVDFNISIAELIRDRIIPGSREIEMSWFELYSNLSADWKRTIESALSEFDFRSHMESTFVWDRQKYHAFRADYAFPNGFEPVKSDIPILPASTARSPFVSDAHKTRTAIGFRVMGENKIIAQCRLDGLLHGSQFMVDVDTFEKDDRRKGFATAASVALLDFCLDQKLDPLWETTEDNTASRRLATKLGFVEDESYLVYAIDF